MNVEMIKQVLLYASAVAIAMVVYLLASQLSFEKSAGKRVREMVGEGANSLFDRSGERLAKRMTSGFFSSWKTSLFWANISGEYKTWTVGGMLARGLAAAIAVVLLIFLFGLPIFTWLMVPFAVFMPYLLVNGKANETKKLVKRLLPETATVIAAEMDAGSTAGQAVSRAGELPGPLGAVINNAVSRARQSERAMFSRGASKGILMEELSKHDLPELSRFAMQLDRVAAKGVDAPRIMVEIARGLAREYRSQIQQTASNMENELLIPMTLFFFLPFIVSILTPVMVSLANAM
jgi:Flp pilus assembly protein TadB